VFTIKLDFVLKIYTWIKPKSLKKMKKKIFTILASIIGVIILLSLYTNSSNFIENQEWKYADGNHIGDWLLKNSFKINNGIIETNQGRAKIIFCYGTEMIIENIESKEKGFYIKKN